MSVVTLFIIAPHVDADDPEVMWRNTFDTHHNERAYDGVLDPNTGHFWVFGAATTETEMAVQVIDFEPSDIQGTIAWQTQYIHGESNTLGKAGHIDASGNVYVAGYWDNGTDPDFFVLKFSDEHPEWSTTLGTTGYADVANFVTTDNEGNVYVTGTSHNGEDNDVTTVKFDSEGQYVWDNTYDSGGDDVQAVLDKMVEDGLKSMISSVFDNPDLYKLESTTTSSSGTMSRKELLTTYKDAIVTRIGAKIDFKNNSKGLFSVTDLRTYFVIGYYDNGTTKDFWLAKVSQDSVVWEKLFDSGYDDVPCALAIDAYYVYVAGYSDNGTDKDFRIIRYDFDGSETWNITYDDGADEEAHGLGVDATGNLYVTGFTDDGADADILTLKYNQPDVIGVKENPSSPPSSATLEVTGNLTTTPIIHYSLPVSQWGTLSFYSVDGRMLEFYNLDPAQSEFSWITDNPAGVYFARLTVGNESITTKAVLAR